MIPRWKRTWPLVLIALGWSGTPAVGAPADDPDGRALLQAAQRTIAAYHAGQPRGDGVVRVVYFHPSDRDPLPHYAERLDRVLNDVSDFYRDGMRRFGLASDGLPLERRNGRLVLHVVRGMQPASGYTHDSGHPIELEARAALRGVFDFDREHVLMIHALCRKNPDGRYVFDAPYYGSGSHRAGVCHAADCELLDPRLLTETKRRIVFTEHYYPHRDETVAEFNSMYLGGTAHELGHGLGLFHDAGMAAEGKFGTALMGAGNLTYRNDRWGGQAPAFLSRISALHLASHPLITGSNRGRWDEIGGEIAELTFGGERGTLRIRGRATGTIPPYAVVAYVWPSRGSDHASQTFPVAVTDGGFELELAGLRPAAYFMRLASLHVNGGATWEDYRFGFDAAGNPMTPQRFKWPWIVDRAEKAVAKREPGARALLTEAAIARAPSDEERRMLRVLREVIEPPAPVELATATGARVFVSDAIWADAKVGWGKVARNRTWFDERIQNGVFLMLGGQFFEKGLYAHSPSRYRFALAGKWQTFTATVGLRDGAQGSAVFTVRADGRELFRSPVLRAGARAEVNVPVGGVRELELIAEGGGGNTGSSWAIWVQPAVAR